jgi:exosortase
MLLGLLIFSSPIWQLAQLSRHNELYSHFMLIPVVSLFFLWVDRKALFAQTDGAPVKGLLTMALGIAVYLAALHGHDLLNRNDYLAVCILGAVIWIHGGFVGVYGQAAYRQARFPLYFLLLCVPLPSFILDPVIRFLQVGSAHAVHLAFEMTGIPYLRDGMTFQLPGIAIEVAKECSGIRSSLILFITSLMAGHMFLKTTWRKVILVLVIIPLTIFKNAVRITTLSLLAVYVDKSWLTDSWLHKGGGIVFFVLALLFLAPVLWALVRSEGDDRCLRWFNFWPIKSNRT